MAGKKTFYDADARARLLAGAEALYSAVKVTLGPKGRNVAVSRKWGAPTVTHDGVTVAKEIELSESVKSDTFGWNMGAQMIKESASQTDEKVGDGTTTATVLAYHMVSEGFRNVAAGSNAMMIRRGLEKAAKWAVDRVVAAGKANPVQSIDKIKDVASISAGDEEIGATIASLISELGIDKDVEIKVEESQGLGIETEIVEGFKFDRGFVSPYMITDAQRMEAAIESPAIFVTDKKLSAVQDVVPIMEKLAQAGKKDVVFIADDVEGEALAVLVVNKLKGVFNAIAVKAPAFGDRRKAMLEDIAALTGATVVSEDVGIGLENVTVEMLGSARKVIADKDNTTIIEGRGDEKAVADRLEQIKQQISQSTSEFDREKLQERLAMLSGKVGIIKVGGATELEIKEKKYRVDDAVYATKAAMDEGIVSGGGSTYLDIAKALEKEPSYQEAKAGDEEHIGWRVLKTALEQPIRLLLENSGISDEKLALVRASEAEGTGVNVLTGEGPVNMLEAGIIDPAKVVRLAIQNAVSVASTMITTNTIVVELPEEEPKLPAGGMGEEY